MTGSIRRTVAECNAANPPLFGGKPGGHVLRRFASDADSAHPKPRYHQSDPMRPRLYILAILSASLGVYWTARPTGAAVPVAPKTKPINYNRDIRPILSENCYYCHGPDHNHRK